MPMLKMMLMMWCSCATVAASTQAVEDLQKLSYPMVRGGRAPIPMVLETMPRKCDLFHRGWCEQFARDRYFTAPVDAPLLEVIVAALAGCNASTCHAIDIGANIGQMTATMLQQGAHVEAYEPQDDYAAALRQTVVLNGWGRRATIHHAALVLEEADVGTTLRIQGFRMDENRHFRHNATFDVPTMMLQLPRRHTRPTSGPPPRTPSLLPKAHALSHPLRPPPRAVAHSTCRRDAV